MLVTCHNLGRDLLPQGVAALVVADVDFSPVRRGAPDARLDVYICMVHGVRAALEAVPRVDFSHEPAHMGQAKGVSLAICAFVGFTVSLMKERWKEGEQHLKAQARGKKTAAARLVATT